MICDGCDIFTKKLEAGVDKIKVLEMVKEVMRIGSVRKWEMMYLKG
jgi:hypothetical protein